MELFKVCRCCLVKIVVQNKFDYFTKLRECFHIVLSTEHKDFGTICGNCTTQLKNAINFKCQVIKAEEKFRRNINVCDIEVADQKYYFESDCKDSSTEVSEDFLHTNATILEKKSLPKRRKLESSQKCKESPLETDIVTNLDTERKHNTKITRISRTKANEDKRKHRINLITILKCSNATPFKKKSLLGYICGYCENTYADPQDLRSHTAEQHTKERSNFKAKFDVTEYVVKLDVTNLCCTICHKSLDSLDMLKEHLVKIHKETIYLDVNDHIMQFKLNNGTYSCALCTSTYETFKTLTQHMNTHYRNYSCKICEAGFVNRRSLKSHELIHRDGNYTCQYCKKVFPSPQKKGYHEKTKHLGRRIVKNCPHCSEKFTSYYQRNQHLVNIHNIAAATYKCNVCDKNFIVKVLLMNHIKKDHLMESNFECELCSQKFFFKKSLNNHIIKHNGNRIYKCEICSKSYARKHTLCEHMRIHNDLAVKSVCKHSCTNTV